MGLFSKAFRMSKQLTKIADGVSNITNLLDDFEKEPDLKYLYVSAWICRVAVIDVIEANEYPSYYTLYASIKGHQTKMTIMEVYGLTIGRISAKAEKQSPEVQAYVQSILDKGFFFNEIDMQILEETKKIFL